MSARRWFVGGVAAIAAVPVAVALAAPGDLSRVSVKNDGSQSTTGGFRGVTSGSGRYVAFISAENLTGVATGGKLQVYVRDRMESKTLLASATAAGAVANNDVDAGDSFNAFIDISADGRYVVFASTATNLVDGDTNAKEDVFRKDLVSGELVRLSVTSSGEQGNNDSTDPSVSGDGTRTVFRTAATNILPGVSTFGVALRDTVAGTTTLVSANGAGVQANDFAERPTISADGSTAAFEAGPTTTNLYANDTNATNDIIVKNLATGVTTAAAVINGATPAEGANVLGGNVPDISGTGRYVVFQTGGILDPVNDANAQNDVYRRDLQTGTTTLVSARRGLPAAGGASASAGSITADGERAAFISDSTNLIPADGNGVADAFARTFTDQATVRLSEQSNGGEVAQAAETAGVAGNGGLGIFSGPGALASLDDTNAADDVYAKLLAPTDTTVELPTFTGSGGVVPDDPSGIASLVINGVHVRPNADRTYSVTLPASSEPCGGAIDTSILDGAGNALRSIVSPSCKPNPPICCMPPPIVIVRVLRARLTLKLVKVTIKLNKAAKGTVSLKRIVKRPGKKEIKVRVSKLRPVSVKAERTLTVTFPRPKRAGKYLALFSFTVGTNHLTQAYPFTIR